MVKYTDEQTEYNVDEQEHEDKEVQLAKCLYSIGWNVYSCKCLIEIISIEDTKQAYCTLNGSTKLANKTIACGCHIVNYNVLPIVTQRVA